MAGEAASKRVSAERKKAVQPAVMKVSHTQAVWDKGSASNAEKIVITQPVENVEG